MRIRKVWVALGVVAVLTFTGRRLSAGDGHPESYEFTLNGTSKGVVLRVKAPGRPAIVWEDVSGRGEPIRGARIGGVSLGSRILSGSLFTLYPDRVGEWTYDFGMRRLPDHVRGLERAAQPAKRRPGTTPVDGSSEQRAQASGQALAGHRQWQLRGPLSRSWCMAQRRRIQ
jgi:hypothetical protein